jgi:hypothetical protein
MKFPMRKTMWGGTQTNGAAILDCFYWVWVQRSSKLSHFVIRDREEHALKKYILTPSSDVPVRRSRDV